MCILLFFSLWGGAKIFLFFFSWQFQALDISSDLDDCVGDDNDDCDNCGDFDAWSGDNCDDDGVSFDDYG